MPRCASWRDEVLALLDADRADENRLAALVALGDVLDDGVELGYLALVDQVCLVGSGHRLVGRDLHHAELVGGHQLGGLGGRRAGHPGELVVHAEVVLQRDRGEGLVLLFDLHALFGLDGLVDALAPAAPLEDATGELVDDLHLAVLDDVVLVLLVQLLGLEGDLHLVDEVLLHLVVEVLDAESGLDLVDARLQRHDDALVLLDLVVHVALELADDLGELAVQDRRVGDAPGDDQRGPGLVDEDRVDLVDDGVVVPALGLVDEPPGHVVAQVVEAHLVVRAVRDVGAVLLALLGGRRLEPGDDQADVEAEEAVDAAHPLGVAPGQVVVDGDEVDAVAAEAVEVRRQGRHQGLALTGLHLGDPAEVQRRAAHDLHVVVALADGPPRRLAHHGEGLDGDVVEVGAVAEPLAEVGGLGAQLVVGEPLELRLEGVDVGDHALQRLQLLALAGAEDAIEDAHAGFEPTGYPCPGSWRSIWAGIASAGSAVRDPAQAQSVGEGGGAELAGALGLAAGAGVAVAAVGGVVLGPVVEVVARLHVAVEAVLGQGVEAGVVAEPVGLLGGRWDRRGRRRRHRGSGRTRRRRRSPARPRSRR